MIVKLENICNFLSGYPWKASSFQEDGIPIIRINNMNTSDNQFVYWQEYYDKKYLIKQNDLLLSLSGTIKTFKWNGPEALLNQRILKITPQNEEVVNVDWIYYQLSYSIRKISNTAKEATIKNVSINDIKSFEVDLPALHIQNKIVSVLDKASSIINKRENSLDILDKYLIDTFLEMFSDPVFNQKGWKLKPLKEIISKIDAGWSPVCEEIPRENSNQLAVLKQGAVSKRIFDSSQNKLLPDSIRIKKKVLAEKGNLLFSRKNTKEMVGSTVYLFEDYENLLLPDTIFNLRYDINKASGIFLCFLFNDKNFRIKIQQLRNGAAASMPNISQEKLLSLKIPLPNLKIQQKFEKIVLDVNAKRKRIHKSLDELNNLFGSILQRAFNEQLNFNVDFELDALINEIDLQKKHHDISKIEQDIAYLQRLIDKLNNQDFKEQVLYDKAKVVALQLMNEKEESRKVTQEYEEKTQSIRLSLV